MAQTTTARNACDVMVYIADAAGDLTDISGSSSTAEFEITNNIGDFRTFGSRWPGRLVCGSDGTINLNIVYSTTADEGYDIVRDWMTGTDYNQPRTVRLDVPDNEANSERWEFEAFIVNFPLSLDTGEPGPIMLPIDFLPTGDIIHSTIGS